MDLGHSPVDFALPSDPFQGTDPLEGMDLDANPPGMQLESTNSFQEAATGGTTDAPVRKQSSGNASFGEIDLASMPPGPGNLSLSGTSSPPSNQTKATGEFNDFPTRDTSAGRPGDGQGGLDLDMAGSLMDSSQHGAEGLTKGEGTAAHKPSSTFKGRRRFERQSRRTKIIALLALFLALVGGGALTFTPLGPFGAYALYKLIPTTADANIVQQTELALTHQLEMDTPQSFAAAQTGFYNSLKEVPHSEDLRMLGFYFHKWHQIRFGLAKKHDMAAAKLLESINLEESSSPFAPLARASQYVRTEKYQQMEKALIGEAGRTPNGLALLIAGYGASGDYQRALKSAVQLDKSEKSPRAMFLLGRALYQAGKEAESEKILVQGISKYPNHVDGALLLAHMLVDNTPPERERIEEITAGIQASGSSATEIQRAYAHAIRGSVLLRDRQFGKAAKEFDSAAELDPENLSMLIGKGEIALRDDDLPSAALSFNKALTRQPDNLEATLGLSEVALRQGDLVDSKAKLEKLIAEHPNAARAHYLMGNAHAALKDNANAEKALQKAMELDKTYLEAYVALSELYLAWHRDTDAMAVLDKASEAVPGSPIINQTLADAHAARSDYASAIIELNKALDLDENNLRSHFRMAQMYRKMGAAEDALRSLQEVEKRDPSYPGLTQEQGQLLEMSGEVDKALEAYKTALAKSPDDVLLKTRVGVAAHLLGDNGTAEKLLKEAAQIQPDSPEVNFYLGEVYRVTKKGSDAAKFLKNAVSLASDNALYHVRYGMALLLLHDTVQAMTEVETALQLDPKLAEAHIRQGQLLLQQGSAKDAVKAFDKGLNLDPTIAEAYGLVAKAFEDLSDLKSAIEYYRKATNYIKNDGELYFKLALVELTVHGNTVASRSLREAVKLGKQSDPAPKWLPEALYRLGVALEKMGQKGNASDAFEEYLKIAPANHLDRSEVLAHLEELKR